MEAKATRMKNFQCKITAVVGFCSGLALLTFVYSSGPAGPPKITEFTFASTEIENYGTLHIHSNTDNIRIRHKVEKQLSDRSETSDTPTVLDSCPKDLTFALAKTHKTGSSTLKTILNSFRNRKESESSKYGKQIQEYPRPFIGGYPGSFRRDLAVVEEFTSDGAKVLKPLVGANVTQKADFLVTHSRFNIKDVTAVMNPKARYFTILREPKRQFESSFYFYYGRYSTRYRRKNPITCHWFPYLQITQKFGTSLSEYLTLIENNLNETISWFFRCMNPQSYDLGFDPMNVTSDYVIKKAKEIDAKFDLVLILEHLPESLVLLKDLMCMGWTDIIPPRNKNKGTYVPLNFTVEEEKIIKHFTKQDSILYNYFNATLWRKIEKYGRERMKTDVKILNKYVELSKIRMTDKKLRRRPNIHKSTNETRDGTFVPRRERLSDSSKIKKVMSRIIQQQGGRKIQESFLEKVAKYMVENGGWCPR